MFKKPCKPKKDEPIILYHGTNSRHFKKILKEGIQPRGKKKSNWENIGVSRPDLVYLTNCYACYYACCSAKKDNDKEIIIKVRIDPKKIKLYLDEEFIYHILGYNEADNKTMAMELCNTINPKDLNPIIKSNLKRIPTWIDSLNFMGTVSCNCVPRECLIEYAILDKAGIFYCDPSISPLNYKIMADEYIKHLTNLNYIKI